ncbi:hypothetical protein [Larkinella rosea]|uniref:DUF4177 domain-containing protein n=1 Tax=Larkinella rosea TaxID=2025312 RepID=A0A3P1C1N2_9BACT|nr:hypothetical protein [Larkinella rosea]RRB07149.1 hypothetical protein EHT25_05045 [Larkinella rosea]
MATEYQIVTLVQNAQPNPEGKYDPIHWEQDNDIADMLSNGYKPEQITTTSGEKGLITLTILFSRPVQTASPQMSGRDQVTLDRFAQKAERGY